MLAIANANPVNWNVGLPDTPLPFDTLMPLPLVLSVRDEIVFGALLTITPVEAPSSEADVPFRAIMYAPCAPPSVIPIPVPVEKYRLLGKPVCKPTVRNVCVSDGLEVIAETVV
jgi:hypothetical protein